jgi:3-dehydroquinate synthase
MRGVAFGFVPTTLLALVDASIGGKNGIDVGFYKNMIGTIRHPSFILHDLQFLNTLPEKDWINGFAEIIKHACIKDAGLFKELESTTLKKYRNKKTELGALIQKNVLLKTKVVQCDEFEMGERKLLNFGHTLGHAIENQYELSHGHAISIGMSYASELSEKVLKFKHNDRVINLLQKYRLPTAMKFDKEKVFNVLKMDKKIHNNSVHFILLAKLGKAVINEIQLDHLYDSL